jgi:DNA-binding MarR family transcriptional regulator
VPSADGGGGPAAGSVGLGLADVVSRLRRAMRRAARASGSGGSLPGGLSVAQLEFLSCLAENPAARPSQLARLLRLAPSSVATLVNSLARTGLVIRTGGVADRRTAVLELTPTGNAVLAEWQDLNAQILAAALTALPASGRRSLQGSLPALGQLTVAIDALADDAHPRLVEGAAEPGEATATAGG